MILKFLKDNWQLVALALALSLAAFFTSKANDARDTALAEVRTLEAKLEAKDLLISMQNDGIDALGAARAEDRKVYLAGLQAANKRAISLEVDAAELLRLPSPATRDEQCAAAEALLRKELIE